MEVKIRYYMCSESGCEIQITEEEYFKMKLLLEGKKEVLEDEKEEHKLIEELNEDLNEGED